MERTFRYWETEDLKQAHIELKAKSEAARKAGNIGVVAELIPVLEMLAYELRRRRILV